MGAVAFSTHQLPSKLRVVAKQLAVKAKEDKLVLFLGAGCSKAAGLPLWGDLLKQLAEEAGMSVEERTAMSKFNFLDQARILERPLGGNTKLTQAITKQLSSRRPALLHCLTQALPGKETITYR